MKLVFIWRRAGAGKSQWHRKVVEASDLARGIVAFHGHAATKLKLEPSAYEVDHPVVIVGDAAGTKYSLTMIASPFQIHFQQRAWPVGHFPAAGENASKLAGYTKP